MAAMDSDAIRRIESELRRLNVILETDKFIQGVNPIIFSEKNNGNWDIKIQFSERPAWDIINHWKAPGEKSPEEYLNLIKNLVLDYIINFKVLPPVHTVFELDNFYVAILKGYGPLQFKEVEAILSFNFEIGKNKSYN